MRITPFYSGIFGIVIGATLATAILVYGKKPPNPRSFEECVLLEMKGRNDSMLRFAVRECRNRFTDPTE